ncbi:MAG: hypothetical protein RL748_2955, partial [Pseudomonadota bacterium]
HTRKNPLHKVTEDSEVVETARGGEGRRLQKAFLKYHDPANWPILREGLQAMGRADLIGNGAKHLIPAWNPGDKPTGSLIRSNNHMGKQSHAPNNRIMPKMAQGRQGAVVSGPVPAVAPVAAPSKAEALGLKFSLPAKVRKAVAEKAATPSGKAVAKSSNFAHGAKNAANPMRKRTGK